MTASGVGRSRPRRSNSTVAHLERSGIGRLRIACIPALGMSIMPAIPAKFKIHYPDVRITLRTISSSDIREGLLNGSAEIMLKQRDEIMIRFRLIGS
jgi:DNA-binding transcriptional LysR family regulator